MTTMDLPNYSPQEAALVPPLELQTVLLRRNWEGRHTTDSYWRRLHRSWCKQAARELRSLTARPSKRVKP
jgi:hypothetical protein